MPDVFSPQKRSQVMSRIRSTGTGIERNLLGLVVDILGPDHKVQENVRGMPGAPDILISSLNLVIFADGCFYHVCPTHGRVPGSNRSYWEPKLQANRLRDGRNDRKLRAMGISVWHFWEHDLKGKRLDRTGRILKSRLEHRMHTLVESL